MSSGARGGGLVLSDSNNAKRLRGPQALTGGTWEDECSREAHPRGGLRAPGYSPFRTV